MNFNSNLLNLAFGSSPLSSTEVSLYDDPSYIETTNPELFHQAVLEHAKYIGLNPEEDTKYLWIARESLICSLPAGWQILTSSDGIPYYYNNATRYTCWEHPKDHEYIQLYNELKEKDRGRDEFIKRSSVSNVSLQSTVDALRGSYDKQNSTSNEIDEKENRKKKIESSKETSNLSTATVDERTKEEGSKSTSKQMSVIKKEAKKEGTSTKEKTTSHEDKTATFNPKTSPDLENDEILKSEEKETEEDTYEKERKQEKEQKEGEEDEQWNQKKQEEYNERSQKEKAKIEEEKGMEEQQRKEEKERKKKKKEAQRRKEQMEEEKRRKMEEQEKSELMKQISELHEENKKLQHEIEKYEETLAQNNENRTLLAEQLSCLQTKLDKEKHGREEFTEKTISSQQEKFELLQEMEQLREKQKVEILNYKHLLETEKIKLQESQDQCNSLSELKTNYKEQEKKQQELQEKIKHYETDQTEEHKKNQQEMEEREEKIQQLTDLLIDAKNELDNLNEENKQLSGKLRELQDASDVTAQLHQVKMEEIKKEKRSMERELSLIQRRFEEAEEAILEKSAIVSELEKKDQQRENQSSEIKMKVKDLEEKNEEMEESITTLQKEKNQYFSMYCAEVTLRRSLHNKLMEVQGNMRVFCRVRPISVCEIQQTKDKEGNTKQIVFTSPVDHQSLELMQLDEINDSVVGKRQFEFDYVFSPENTQMDVFTQTKSFITSALDGYNMCIFAYGQTGSGKTFTMEGPPTDRGINFRTVNELFELQKERSQSEDFVCTIKMSMLEVYNETIVDLLETADTTIGSPTGSKTPTNKPSGSMTIGTRQGLDIRLGKTGPYVDNLRLIEVQSPEQVCALMLHGNTQRSVGSHDINEHSSRSHLVLSFGIDCTIGAKHTTSKLNLIDLAGSERISKTSATGVRLKEAQNINRSLSALGDVIAALSTNQKHVPYRNSKLTFLLQESLSGNSKVLMFVNLSPILYNASETLCSLNFASRCRSVALGQAKVNVT